MKYCEVLHQNLHLQGFTFDGDNMYWSFTDSLVKTTRNGTVKCQVPVLAGHLGDIDYCDGKIYGSVMGNSLKGKPWGVWTSFEVRSTSTTPQRSPSKKLYVSMNAIQCMKTALTALTA